MEEFRKEFEISVRNSLEIEIDGSIDAKMKLD
jgi:hypothetical protein